MKKVLKIILLLISISCNSKSSTNNDIVTKIDRTKDDIQTITKEKESIYFSFSSLCNFQ